MYFYFCLKYFVLICATLIEGFVANNVGKFQLAITNTYNVTNLHINEDIPVITNFKQHFFPISFIPHYIPNIFVFV